MQNAYSFEQFLIIKGLQPITVRGYVGTYKRMSAVLGDYPTVEEVNRYIYDLYTSEYSYSHKTNTALGIERYMELIGRPLKFGRQRKPKPIIKNTLNEAEVTKLIFNCRNSREKAIIAILAYSGLRNLELTKLKVKDVLISQNAIRVIQGKFLKDGISEITPECSEIITQYLSEHPRGPEDYLFTTLRNNHRLATGDVRKWVKVVAKRAGFTKRVYPHILRHSMSCNMLLRGADMITLKKQLRHTWLDSTLHYLNSIVLVERNRYQKFAPSYC